MEEPKKDVYIHIRIDKEVKDCFQQVCKNKCVNASELVRTLIEKWTKENI